MLVTRKLFIFRSPKPRIKNINDNSKLRKLFSSQTKQVENTQARENKIFPYSTEINGKSYVRDSWTNITPKILSYLNRNIYLQDHHPLNLIRKRIVDYFYKSFKNSRGNPLFSIYDRLDPVVSIEQNFNSLLIAPTHPSRAKSDCYYLNQDYLLRAHTTAHQADLIRSGLDHFLIAGEVYRRDEIDSTHYPVFHQIDAVHLKTQKELFKNENSGLEIIEKTANHNNTIENYNKQACHTLEAVKLMEYDLKTSLLGLAKELFGDNIHHRWVPTYFPFTEPSWELEIYYENDWLEVLGCGIIQHAILERAGVKNKIGWAFGLGLERLAMCMYKIPDIRLFWSTDSGFLNQFKVEGTANITYKPVSLYPQCQNDISFWLPEHVCEKEFSPNDFYDLVRSVGGDIIEQVQLVDVFKHPKSGKISHCYRITYRHMEKTLIQSEVNIIHQEIEKSAVTNLGVVVR